MSATRTACWKACSAACAELIVYSIDAEKCRGCTVCAKKCPASAIVGAANHADDCLYCSRNGNCQLQQLAEELDVRQRGFAGDHMRHTVDGMQLGVAVASGLGNASRLLDQIRADRKDLHFIEVMTCPGGCIGGGQPIGANSAAVRARLSNPGFPAFALLGCAPSGKFPTC